MKHFFILIINVIINQSYQFKETKKEMENIIENTAVPPPTMDHYNKNKRTLNNHRWFVEQISLAEDRTRRNKIKNETENLIARNRDKLKIVFVIIICILISYLNTFDHQSFFLRMLVMLLYTSTVDVNPTQLIKIPSVKEDDITLYMRFTRPNIFYKNTHYIFSGTKDRLEKVFGRLRIKVDIYKIDNIKSRDEHDKLMDTPLDTFCNDKCGCDDEMILNYNFDNYQCSHWNLYSYDKHEDLNEDILYIKQIENNDNYRGLRNEFIYL